MKKSVTPLRHINHTVIELLFKPLLVFFSITGIILQAKLDGGFFRSNIYLYFTILSNSLTAIVFFVFFWLEIIERFTRKRIIPYWLLTVKYMHYVMGYVASFADKFREIMGAKHKVELKKELASKRRMIAKSENRIKELDRLFKSIYEDKTKGIIQENRFKMLADDYEREQEELREQITTLTAEIEHQEEQSDNVERFIAKVQKYTDLQELNSTMLNDMVKRVYIHAQKEIDGKRTQDIDISYDLVGMLPLSLFK